MSEVFKMKVSIIAAMGRNGLIGDGNSLPWDLKEDLSYFKKKTIGKPVIMGQKTFESIGHPLPGRTNIVLSRDKKFKPSGCLVAGSIKDALSKAGKAKEVMIAGGASVYQQFLPLACRMYLTLIEGDFKGDVFFPEFNLSEWVEVKKEERSSEKYDYAFIVLERKD